MIHRLVERYLNVIRRPHINRLVARRHRRNSRQLRGERPGIFIFNDTAHQACQTGFHPRLVLRRRGKAFIRRERIDRSIQPFPLPHHLRGESQRMGKRRLLPQRSQRHHRTVENHRHRGLHIDFSRPIGRHHFGHFQIPHHREGEVHRLRQSHPFLALGPVRQNDPVRLTPFELPALGQDRYLRSLIPGEIYRDSRCDRKRGLH